MANDVIDFVTLLQGSRFAVTFLDYSKRDEAINDELMIDKEDPSHPLYYKNKQGEIIKISGGDSAISQEDLKGIQDSIAKALQDAKEYADSKVAVGDGTGSTIVKYEYTIVVEQDNTSEVQIPLSTFTKGDLLLVSTNTVVPSPLDTVLGYTVSEDGLITFNTPFKKDSVIYLVVLKNVPVGEEGTVDAKIISDGTITVSKLSQEVIDHVEQLATDIVTSLGAGNNGTSVVPVSAEEPEDNPTGGLWFQLVNN